MKKSIKYSDGKIAKVGDIIKYSTYRGKMVKAKVTRIEPKKGNVSYCKEIKALPLSCRSYGNVAIKAKNCILIKREK